MKKEQREQSYNVCSFARQFRFLPLFSKIFTNIITLFPTEFTLVIYTLPLNSNKFSCLYRAVFDITLLLCQKHDITLESRLSYATIFSNIHWSEKNWRAENVV